MTYSFADLSFCIGCSSWVAKTCAGFRHYHWLFSGRVMSPMKLQRQIAYYLLSEARDEHQELLLCVLDGPSGDKLDAEDLVPLAQKVGL